jgi:hypothetical protein
MDEQDDLTLVYMWAYKKAEDKYKARIEQLEAALRGVIAVADRNCPEFRAARAALGEKKDE